MANNVPGIVVSDYWDIKGFSVKLPTEFSALNYLNPAAWIQSSGVPRD
jgi:hypothetical protein